MKPILLFGIAFASSLAWADSLKAVSVPDQSIDLYQSTSAAYICPNLSGSYQDGQVIKSPDGEAWSLSITDGGSVKDLAVSNWKRLYLHKDQSAQSYTFYCSGKYQGKELKASLSLNTPASCFTVPDLQYPQFACY